MDELKKDGTHSIKNFLESLPRALPKDLLELNFSDSAVVADTLSQEGELCLKRDELIEAQKLFDQAIKLCPDRASLFVKQGEALLHYGKQKGKEKSLLLANKKFRTASSLTPDAFEVWYLWGRTLSFLAKTFQERHYFLEAELRLKKAKELLSEDSKQKFSELHWMLASVQSALASYSKEPMDFQLSIESFQVAAGDGESLPAEFWDEYGRTCLNLSSYINDVRLCVKAIHFFKHALSQCPSSFHLGWRHLSKALVTLYDYTHDEDHFLQATECFQAALQTRPNDIDLWLELAQLYLSAGRNSSDTKKVKQSIENCYKAYAINPCNALALSLWGEALALIGEKGERLDLLLEGQNKISQALDLRPSDSLVSFSHGQCLNSLGRYYNDIDFHYQAIEKYQEGLTSDRTLHAHWHALAMSYFEIGSYLHDEESFEKALRFFCKAIELKPSCSYYHYDYALCLSRLGETSCSLRWLELSIEQFERALSIQKNAIYLHPEWLYHFARTLDLYGDFFDEDSYYLKAIDLLAHVLMIDPEFTAAYYQMGLCLSHLGELSTDIDHFYKAQHYFKLASRHEEENDSILLDLGITLINIAQLTQDGAEKETALRDAEIKLTKSAKAGNLTAYYQLACLYSLLGQFAQSIRFLEKALSFDALPYSEEILEDEWLEGVRATEEFKNFYQQLEENLE